MKTIKLRNYLITKLLNGNNFPRFRNSVIQSFSNSLSAFTLIELIISVALLISAISIALFATVGVGGLIQRSEARGIISEAGRTIGDEIRRVVNNAPVGGVSLIAPNPDNTTFAGIQVKDYSLAQATNTCTVVGRANVSSTVNGEETYSLSNTGTLVALLIYPVDNAGLCPQLSTTPTYQNRLTNNLSAIKAMNFYLQNIPCVPLTPPTCNSKQLLRFALTIELSQKVTGNSNEAKKPTLTLQDGLAVGLVNETLSSLTIASSVLAGGITGTAYADSVTVTGGSPGYTWSLAPLSTALPPGLSLGATTGIISNTPTAVGTYTPTIRVVDSLGTTVNRQISITITGPPTLAISTTSPMAGGTVGSAYSQTLQATSGTQPYAWSISSGALPTGLSLTAGSGLISGTPSAAGTYNFTAMVTDNVGATATKPLSITVANGVGALTITTSSLPDGTVNTAYSQPVTASGGTAPYTWTVSAGALPTGLSLASGTPSATISGTPTVANTYNFTVRVTDNVGTTVTQALSIVIAASSGPLTITTNSLPNAVHGTPYSANLTATGGTPPYTWSIFANGGFNWLTINPVTGALGGNVPAFPTSGGSFVIFKVVDGVGTQVFKVLMITIQ